MSWLEKTKNALFGSEVEPSAASPAGPNGGTPIDSGVAAVLAAKLVELSSDGLSVEHLDPRGHLFDYGYLDSLSAVSLIGFVEDEYNVEISESDLIGSLDSIEALARHIEEARVAP